MKQGLITQYNNPELEELMNEFATWLVRKQGGRLPAPTIKLLGSSEKLWPVVYESASRTMTDSSFENWMKTSDGCAFPFLGLDQEGELRRLDRQTKEAALGFLFPYYPPDIRAALLDFDAVVFLRLGRLRDPVSHVMVACHEAAFVCSVWLQRELDIYGNLRTWLAKFEVERNDGSGPSNDTPSRSCSPRTTR